MIYRQLFEAETSAYSHTWDSERADFYLIDKALSANPCYGLAGE